MALTRDLQHVLDQIVGFYTAHPEALVDGSITSMAVISRREGNVRGGTQELVPTFRRFRNLNEFSRQHGPFQGLQTADGNPWPLIEVYETPAPHEPTTTEARPPA